MIWMALSMAASSFLLFTYFSHPLHPFIRGRPAHGECFGNFTDFSVRMIRQKQLDALRVINGLIAVFFFLYMYVFLFRARTINALGHCFDSLHHFFQYWFLLEEDNLAGGILKRFFCDIQAFIDY